MLKFDKNLSKKAVKFAKKPHFCIKNIAISPKNYSKTIGLQKAKPHCTSYIIHKKRKISSHECAITQWCNPQRNTHHLLNHKDFLLFIFSIAVASFFASFRQVKNDNAIFFGKSFHVGVLNFSFNVS